MFKLVVIVPDFNVSTARPDEELWSNLTEHLLHNWHGLQLKKMDALIRQLQNAKDSLSLCLSMSLSLSI